MPTAAAQQSVWEAHKGQNPEGGGGKGSQGANRKGGATRSKKPRGPTGTATEKGGGQTAKGEGGGEGGA